MAQKKGGGSTKNGRDSQAKRLGVKSCHGELTKIGEIIVRQRGLTFLPGKNVGRGKDFTLYALKEGLVEFKNYSKQKKTVSIKVNLWDLFVEQLGYKTWQTFKT